MLTLLQRWLNRSSVRRVLGADNLPRHGGVLILTQLRNPGAFPLLEKAAARPFRQTALSQSDDATLLQALRSGEAVVLKGVNFETGSSRRVLFFHQLAVEANALFGSMDHAFETLRSAVDKGLTDLVWLDHCPALSPMRETPTVVAARSALLERAQGIHQLIPR